jgi:hypothetical protein
LPLSFFPLSPILTSSRWWFPRRAIKISPANRSEVLSSFSFRVYHFHLNQVFDLLLFELAARYRDFFLKTQRRADVRLLFDKLGFQLKLLFVNGLSERFSGSDK